MRHKLNEISNRYVQRHFESLKRKIDLWDSENKDASPAQRGDVIELYFVLELRNVSELEMIEFTNLFFELYDANQL